MGGYGAEGTERICLRQERLKKAGIKKEKVKSRGKAVEMDRRDSWNRERKEGEENTAWDTMRNHRITESFKIRTWKGPTRITDPSPRLQRIPLKPSPYGWEPQAFTTSGNRFLLIFIWKSEMENFANLNMLCLRYIPNTAKSARDFDSTGQPEETVFLFSYFVMLKAAYSAQGESSAMQSRAGQYVILRRMGVSWQIYEQIQHLKLLLQKCHVNAYIHPHLEHILYMYVYVCDTYDVSHLYNISDTNIIPISIYSNPFQMHLS